MAWPFFSLFLFLFICCYCSLTAVKSVARQSQALSKGTSWPCHLMQHAPAGHEPLKSWYKISWIFPSVLLISNHPAGHWCGEIGKGECVYKGQHPALWIKLMGTDLHPSFFLGGVHSTYCAMTNTAIRCPPSSHLTHE